MKSLTAVCQTGASMPAINPNGRISRHHPPQRADGENAEMKMYLSKLKDLVPFMPKNRKLSKLEIIQHVIDYICDLQTELESHPEINNFDATIALNIANNNRNVVNNNSLNRNNRNHSVHHQNQNQQQQQQQQHQQHRQNADIETIMGDEIQERLQQNAAEMHYEQQQQQTSRIMQQQSSPIQRQPLADRQTPNTILPPAKIVNSLSAGIIQHQRQFNVASDDSNMSTTPATTMSTSPADVEDELSPVPAALVTETATGTTITVVTAANSASTVGTTTAASDKTLTPETCNERDSDKAAEIQSC